MTANDSTAIIAVPNLSIYSVQTGGFTQGQTGTYTLTVSNGLNAAPTTGTVTVTETLPSALTLVSMAGTGWNCTITCTRSDALAANTSYPTITLTANIAQSAVAPQVDQAAVSAQVATFTITLGAPTPSSGAVVAVWPLSSPSVRAVPPLYFPSHQILPANPGVPDRPLMLTLKQSSPARNWLRSAKSSLTTE